MRLTKQYANALLKSTSKEEAVAVYKELINVTDLFEQFPEYIGLIEFQTEEFETVRSIFAEKVEPLVLNFLEVLAEDRLLSQLETVIEDYRLVLVENNLLFEVKVYSSTPLSEDNKAQLVQMIESQWGSDYLIDYRVDPKTLGGIKLVVNGAVIDTTFRSRIDQIIREVQHGAKDEQIVQRLKERIQQIDWEFNDLDTGTVLTVGDGIALARGLRGVQANELVRFEDGTLGLALNLEENQVGIILLGNDRNIRENDTVYRTEEIASVPVGDALLGRVVDPLGNPVDGKGEIEFTEEREVERQAPGVMTRKSVHQPLHTGVKIVDAMIPIGKGQRELIIGDRQTGKTSIALNAILNQKGQNVKCVYVAIGQKASTVVEIVETLKRYGADKYTVVVNSPADHPSALQYLSPYSGTAMGEYWMDKGEDVLIVYDDLSKHAVAYRTISLLLKRPSGREAYPGDVFYLHSRLLERSGKLNEQYGNGSMTALPIIETQLGDISAYIPTNVISITDGQLFLNTEEFHAGRRPAVDSGLSVSRVGSDAQTSAMKNVASSLRLELAQFQEMQAFAQFSSDIDAETKNVIDHGRRLTELLKQPAHLIIPHELVVLSLFLSKHGWIDKLEVSEVRKFEAYVHTEFTENYSDILAEIAEEFVIDESLEATINEVLEKLYKDFTVIGNG